MPTKDKILFLLRKEPRTLAELAIALGLSRNAIVLQTKQLIADGLIRRGARRPAEGAGKPAYEFEPVEGSEDHASKAYQPLVQGLLAVLRQKLPRQKLDSILKQTGLEIARTAGLPASGTLNQKLKAALDIVNSLGAEAEVVRHTDGRLMVRNTACPFASAVRQDACVCKTAAAFFEQASGLRVEEACVREDRLTCQYIIDKKKPAARK